MITSFMKWYGVVLLGVGLLTWRAMMPSPTLPSATEDPVTLQDVDFSAYDMTGRRYHVTAQTAAPSTLRFGFLHLALVPTVEMREVVIERARPDGTIERVELPEAVVEWESKTVRTSSGRIIASTQQW